jgi:formiminoglutamase
MSKHPLEATINAFVPSRPELFYSRNDEDDPRLGSIAKPLAPSAKLTQGAVVIAGYPDDDGIRLNGGRPGAHMAPPRIRQYLYRMTPPFDRPCPPLWDIGDLKMEGDLASRHERGQQAAKAALDANQKWLAFGGGHDYGYCEGAAFLQWALTTLKTRPLIVNFDAHLDVRPTNSGLHSGTAFRRLIEKFPGAFDFAEIGLQRHCNSAEHLEWAKSKGVRCVFMEDTLGFSSWADGVLQLLGDWITPNRPTFMSVDIDGFASSFAMGCSQSWPTGFAVQDYFSLFHTLTQKLNISVLGIYEVSPPLDQDDRTAKLAALVAHRWIFSLKGQA